MRHREFIFSCISRFSRLRKAESRKTRNEKNDLGPSFGPLDKIACESSERSRRDHKKVSFRVFRDSVVNPLDLLSKSVLAHDVQKDGGDVVGADAFVGGLDELVAAVGEGFFVVGDDFADRVVVELARDAVAAQEVEIVRHQREVAHCDLEILTDAHDARHHVRVLALDLRRVVQARARAPHLEGENVVDAEAPELAAARVGAGVGCRIVPAAIAIKATVARGNGDERGARGL